MVELRTPKIGFNGPQLTPRFPCVSWERLDSGEIIDFVSFWPLLCLLMPSRVVYPVSNLKSIFCKSVWVWNEFILFIFEKILWSFQICATAMWKEEEQEVPVCDRYIQRSKCFNFWYHQRKKFEKGLIFIFVKKLMAWM